MAIIEINGVTIKTVAGEVPAELKELLEVVCGHSQRMQEIQTEQLSLFLAQVMPLVERMVATVEDQSAARVREIEARINIMENSPAFEGETMKPSTRTSRRN